MANNIIFIYLRRIFSFYCLTRTVLFLPYTRDGGSLKESDTPIKVFFTLKYCVYFQTSEGNEYMDMSLVKDKRLVLYDSVQKCASLTLGTLCPPLSKRRKTFSRL